MCNGGVSSPRCCYEKYCYERFLARLVVRIGAHDITRRVVLSRGTYSTWICFGTALSMRTSSTRVKHRIMAVLTL